MNLPQIGFFVYILLVLSFFFYSNKYVPNKPNKRKGYSHPIWMTHYYNTPNKRQLIYYISAIVRTFIPIILFRYLHPCNAMILNQIIVDNIDPLYLVNINSPYYNRNQYQNWDKFFDLWGYFVALLPVFTNYYPNFISYHIFIPNILIALFILRLLGYLCWKFIIKREELFIYFPDLYTSLYYAISFAFLFKINNKTIITCIITIALFLKILHELHNHK